MNKFRIVHNARHRAPHVPQQEPYDGQHRAEKIPGRSSLCSRLSYRKVSACNQNLLWDKKFNVSNAKGNFELTKMKPYHPTNVLHLLYHNDIAVLQRRSSRSYVFRNPLTQSAFSCTGRDVTLALPLRFASGMLRNGGHAPGENVSCASNDFRPTTYYDFRPKSAGFSPHKSVFHLRTASSRSSFSASQFSALRIRTKIAELRAVRLSRVPHSPV